jgi:hypothetical protein
MFSVIICRLNFLYTWFRIATIGFDQVPILLCDVEDARGPKSIHRIKQSVMMTSILDFPIFPNERHNNMDNHPIVNKYVWLTE